MTSTSNAATAASVLLSIGMIGVAPIRDRPDELIGGLFALTVSVLLGARVTRSARASRTQPILATLGWALQLGAIAIYYYSDFARDAALYHTRAAQYASGAQALVWPETNWGNEGISAALSLVYRVTGPSMLLGFVLFGAMGLAGKLLVARVLIEHRDVLGRGSEVGAVLVVLLPSLNLWLGAISKEGLVVLGTGLFISGLIRRRRPPSVLMMVIGLALITLVRAHVALLLSASAIAYLVFTVVLPRRQGGGRVFPLAAGAALTIVALVAAAAYLGTEATVGELDERRVELSQAADPGRSNVEVRAITSPAQIPAGVANVLLRPFPWEARGLASAAQATENVLMVIGLAWLAAQGRRRRQNTQTRASALRVRAIRLFGGVYLIGFTFAFSITYNLGLASRQRAQLWLPAMVLLATAFVHVRRGGAPRLVPRAAAPTTTPRDEPTTVGSAGR
jgi:hypothetical protein